MLLNIVHDKKLHFFLLLNSTANKIGDLGLINSLNFSVSPTKLLYCTSSTVYKTIHTAFNGTFYFLQLNCNIKIEYNITMDFHCASHRKKANDKI